MKPLFLLSVALGISFGGTLYLIYQLMGIDPGLTLTILAAMGFTMLLFAFLVIHQKLMDRRYAETEAQIPYPVFYKTNGNFDLGGGKIKNGNIYFCDAGIVCVSKDTQPYPLDQILRQDICKLRYDTIHLHIHTKDGRVFKITLPDAETIITLLIERDWVE